MNNKKEQKARNIALWIIGVMIVIWVVLGIFSFRESGNRTRPKTPNISFEGQTALRGKQVFQAYNGMDCHTIVGNGAYFAPDLTKIYEEAGPAWLKAYLSSPGSYPTKALVNIQLQQQIQSGELKVTDLDQYFEKFKGAERRIIRRGGQDALMPNLPFKPDEIDALVAFFKYTAKMNTAGWPPKVIAREAVVRAERKKLEEKSGVTVIETAEVAGTAENNSSQMVTGPAARGKIVATNMGCMACHSTDGSIKVGPSWKGLYNSTVALEGGQTTHADSAYIIQSILDPDAKIVKGFQKGLMPSYQGVINGEELSDLVSYITSIK